MADVSIIIPVYHALNELKACLSSLEKVHNLDKAEIILVNDCPGSETAEFLLRYAESHDVVLINNIQNMGFIKSCNKAISEATSPVLLLLNSDTEVPVSLIDKVIDCFQSNEKIACAAPLGGNGFDKRIFFDVNQADSLVEKMLGKEKYIQTLVPHGFCFAIRKSAIDKIGMLDEVFGKGYCEENDLACRALQAGYINVVMVNMYVLHKVSASFGGAEALQRISHNKKILNARWKEFLHQYKKDHPHLFKENKYMRRFCPWYYNCFQMLIGALATGFLCFFPKTSMIYKKLKQFRY